MSYDLQAKILNRLTELGVTGATIRDMTISAPTPTGEFHWRVEGVVTEEKLATIAQAYKALVENAA